MYRFDLREHLKRLRPLAASVRESIEVAATALQATIQARTSEQNMKLQRTMRWLTLIGVGLALLSLFLGLPKALLDWDEFLAPFLTRFK